MDALQNFSERDVRDSKWTTLLLVVSLSQHQDSGTLFHWAVRLLHPLIFSRTDLRHSFSVCDSNIVLRASVLWRIIDWLIDWLRLTGLAVLCSSWNHNSRRRPTVSQPRLNFHSCRCLWLRLIPSKFSVAVFPPVQPPVYLVLFVSFPSHNVIAIYLSLQCFDTVGCLFPFRVTML